MDLVLRGISILFKFGVGAGLGGMDTQQSADRMDTLFFSNFINRTLSWSVHAIAVTSARAMICVPNYPSVPQFIEQILGRNLIGRECRLMNISRRGTGVQIVIIIKLPEKSNADILLSRRCSPFTLRRIHYSLLTLTNPLIRPFGTGTNRSFQSISDSVV